jgi:hypothetical protein
LYNEGAPGLSNAFGAALWGLDFNLWCASQGIQRVYMHQGTDYRYASWQPVSTAMTSIGTKAPYYGNVAVAAFLGNLTAAPVRVANIPLSYSYESAYASYASGKLAKLVVVNMREYNYTVNGTSKIPNPVKRPQLRYTFKLPSYCASTGEVMVQRLMANGSDAISGISFGGYSYNYELDLGRPVKLKNITASERLLAKKNMVSVVVPDSSAVILIF